MGRFNNYKKFNILYLKKYIIAFYQNFFGALREFGENYEVRNSPVFFMIASFVLKFGVELDYLKYLNLIIILLIIIFFVKSINLKFQNLSITSITLLTSIIFLSPTLRSLTAWPYPLLYAICFFQISIFYFLKIHRGTKTKRLKYWRFYKTHYY